MEVLLHKPEQGFREIGKSSIGFQQQHDLPSYAICRRHCPRSIEVLWHQINRIRCDHIRLVVAKTRSEKSREGYLQMTNKQVSSTSVCLLSLGKWSCMLFTFLTIYVGYEHKGSHSTRGRHHPVWWTTCGSMPEPPSTVFKAHTTEAEEQEEDCCWTRCAAWAWSCCDAKGVMLLGDSSSSSFLPKPFPTAPPFFCFLVKAFFSSFDQIDWPIDRSIPCAILPT